MVNIKKIYKITLICLAFMAGLFFHGVLSSHKSIKVPIRTNNLTRTLNGYVYCEAQIERQIEDIFYIDVPSEATNLYCAIDGFFYLNCYAALTLPTQKKCEEFLVSQFAISLDDFVNKDLLPEDVMRKGPSTWSDELKGNWDIESHKSFLYFHKPAGFGQLRIVYVSESCRIYIFDKKDIPLTS